MIRSVVVVCAGVLLGACFRNLPASDPLKFDCKLDVKENDVVMGINEKEVTLTLTPKNAGTRTGGLQLTSWHLPEGLNGMLFNEKGEEIKGDIPLAWGKHKWKYRPHQAGDHIITLCFKAPYEKDLVSVDIDPIKIKELWEGFRVTSSIRNMTVEERKAILGKEEDGVAIDIYIESVPEKFEKFHYSIKEFPVVESIKFLNKDKKYLKHPVLGVNQKGDVKNTFFFVYGPNDSIKKTTETIQINGPNKCVVQGQVDLSYLNTKMDEFTAKWRLKKTNANAKNQNLNRLKKNVNAESKGENLIAEQGSLANAIEFLCKKNSLNNEEEDILENLVKKEPSIRLTEGNRPIRIAVRGMNLEAVRVLVKIADSIGSDATTVNDAVLVEFLRKKTRNKKRFDLLFDELINVKYLRDETDKTGRTPLMEAARLGDIGLLKKLTEKGAKTDTKTKVSAWHEIIKPVYELSEKGFLYKVPHRELFSSGRIKVSGWTALHEAIAHGNDACVDYLMDVGRSNFVLDTEEFSTAKLKPWKKGDNWFVGSTLSLEIKNKKITLCY